MLSEVAGASGSLSISGFEMLKGLQGVTTHRHVERVSIFDNTQDMPQARRHVEILEFLFEATGRMRQIGGPHPGGSHGGGENS